MHADLEVAYESISKLSRMDMDPSVLVWLAHDRSLDLALQPGDLVRLEGGRDELNKLKSRERYVFQ
jgi:hypothetical protein